MRGQTPMLYDHHAQAANGPYFFLSSGVKYR